MLVTEASRELGLSGRPAMSRAAVELMRAHPWPGNVRELRNVVQRAVLLSAGGPIGPEHLPIEKSVAPRHDAPLRGSQVERQRIVNALEMFLGNQTRAAAYLGIPRRTFVARLAAYGIPRPRKDTPIPSTFSAGAAKRNEDDPT
jgi:DNA-binding NtrC family response regulator